jgi:hypothetical protein
VNVCPVDGTVSSDAKLVSLTIPAVTPLNCEAVGFPLTSKVAPDDGVIVIVGVSRYVPGAT